MCRQCADDVQMMCRQHARDARCSTAWNWVTQARGSHLEQLCIKPNGLLVSFLADSHSLLLGRFFRSFYTCNHWVKTPHYYAPAMLCQICTSVSGKTGQSTMTSMPLQTSLQVRECYVLLHTWQNKQVLTDWTAQMSFWRTLYTDSQYILQDSSEVRDQN